MYKYKFQISWQRYIFKLTNQQKTNIFSTRFLKIFKNQLLLLNLKTGGNLI